MEVSRRAMDLSRQWLVGDEGLDRVAGHEVRTPHEEGFGFGVQLGEDGAHRDLDLFRRGFTHADDVLLAQVVLDVGREDIAGHADGVLLDDTAQGDDGDFGGAAADVDDHVALRRLDVQADTEGRGHRFEDQVDVPAAGVLGGVTDGTDLHFRGAAGDAHDQLQVRGEEAAVPGVDLADETADHHLGRVEVRDHAVHLGRVEVRDHAVTQRTDGADAGVRLLMHELGLLAEGDALVGGIVDGDDGGLVQNDLVVLENDRVGRAKVHCELLVQETECHIVIFKFDRMELSPKLRKKNYIRVKIFALWSEKSIWS